MSVLSSPCYLNEELKEKYEFNQLSNINLQSQSIVTSQLDYPVHIFSSYADKNKALDDKRPLTSYSVNGYRLSFDSMQKETQENLKDAWAKRNESPFKDRIDGFIDYMKTKYHIHFDLFLHNNDISVVWNRIKEEDNRMCPNEYIITKLFFNALGGAYSRSKDIEDESFRKNFPKYDWLQNPHGEQYRQHQTGRGALTPVAPSEESIKIFEEYIKKGYNPFNGSQDLEHILSKIENPIDKYGLKAIALNEPICAAPSGTAIRIMNLWDDISKQIKKESYKGTVPTKLEIEELCRVYLCGSRDHHTESEVNSVLTNRRGNVDREKDDNFNPKIFKSSFS